jgi:hypothetical protein
MEAVHFAKIQGIIGNQGLPCLRNQDWSELLYIVKGKEMVDRLKRGRKWSEQAR